MPFFQARPFSSRVKNPKGMADPKESVPTVSVLHRSLCKRTSEVAGDSKQLITQDLSHEGLMGLENKTTACVRVFHTHHQHCNSCCVPKSLGSYPAL